MNIKFFARAAEFRRWLAKNHARVDELWVGLYVKSSNRPSITWPEAVDEALCFGWIDGIRKKVDVPSYTIRFTPRRAKGIWSNRNIQRVRELTERGLMQPSGLKAFEARKRDRSGIYSFEQRHHILDPSYERKLKANKLAWAFFRARPPWYRRTASHWIMSAKKEETRLRRLATLIVDSARGRTIAPLTRPDRER